MKLIAPDYYTEFQCTAGLCKHNCCVGWEIDVDENTHAFYKSVKGDFGKKLSENISEGETPCFKLGENERCPFLNKDNLCDIILELGEGALCQICADHPRFRNFYDDRVEIGLGLCCEAAAQLILERKEKVQLVELESDGEYMDFESEEDFFNFRNGIFNIIQNRTISINERTNSVLCKLGIDLSKKSLIEWADIYESLEQLDETWKDKLSLLKNTEIPTGSVSDTVLEQLLVYFIYRHLAEVIYDGRIRERIAFAILSVHIIHALCAVCDEPITEIARMYSSEIEYSEENIETLLNMLSEELK